MDVLPNEVLEMILSHCEKDDLINLACCSRSHRSSVYPFLWKDVTITFPTCGTLQHRQHSFHNLKHTTHFSLCWLRHGEKKTKTCTTQNCCITYAKKVCEFTINYTKLLNAMCPEKVQSLEICGGSEVDCLIRSTFESLVFVRELKLCDLDLCDWSSVLVLRCLTVLHIQQCSITDNELISLVEKIVGKQPQLMELTLENCSNLTYTFVLPVAKLTTLTKLSLIDLNNKGDDPSDPPMLDLCVLSTLTNLVCLTLSNVQRCGNLSLNPLWPYLVNLKELILMYIVIGDEDLREIKCLSSLEFLVLDNVHRLSSECFSYISALPSLRRLSFSINICLDGNDTYDAMRLMESHVSQLNDMQALCAITIKRDDEERYFIEMLLRLLFRSWNNWMLKTSPLPTYEGIADECHYYLFRAKQLKL